MPCNYAHYRLGKLALPQFPGDARQSVQRFRRLYNAGLQGPDLFFYYDPLMKTAIGRLGRAFHHQTGKEFFGLVCRQLRSAPTEAGLVYIYGLLGHYCLDATIHPYVQEVTAEGTPGHVALEVEFDRFLLEKDGRTPPHRQYLGKNVKLTRGEYETVAHFLQPATAWNVRRSFATMKLCMWGLSAPALRKPLGKLLPHMPPKVAQQLMTEGPNPLCAGHDEKMQELFDHALERYPQMLAALREYIQNGTPLGPEFDPIFG